MGLRPDLICNGFHVLNTTLSAHKPVICRKTEEISGEKGCRIRILRLQRSMRRPPGAAPADRFRLAASTGDPANPILFPPVQCGRRPWGEVLRKAARRKRSQVERKAPPGVALRRSARPSPCAGAVLLPPGRP